MKHIVHARAYLYLEIILLLLVLPLLLSTLIPLRYMLPTIWLTALYCHMIYRAIVDASERVTWRWNMVDAAHVKPILCRFAVATVLLGILTYVLVPPMFLSFVRTNPAFWALIMVLYPLLSVVPQEIIFRSFFFERYGRLFKNEAATVLASGILFGAAHLIFQNWVAPLLCAIGGVMFARTYAQTRSLALVSLEHAMYGCMIFTVGLGRYFYHGGVPHH